MKMVSQEEALQTAVMRFAGMWGLKREHTRALLNEARRLFTTTVLCDVQAAVRLAAQNLATSNPAFKRFQVELLTDWYDPRMRDIELRFSIPGLGPVRHHPGYPPEPYRGLSTEEGE